MMRRFSPPDNEVAATVELDAILVRHDDLSVALEGAKVYSTGVLFTLRVLTRRDRPDVQGIFFGGRPDAFLFGVEFADGSRAVNTGSPGGRWSSVPGLPMLASHGGGGGDRSVRQEYFLTPVPPAGPLTFYVYCDALGIGQTSTTVDAAPLVEALSRVAELWPWEPANPSPTPPEPPSLPPGTWFAEEA